MAPPNATGVSRALDRTLSESDAESVAEYLLSFDWAMRDPGVAKVIVNGGMPLWLQILSLVPKSTQKGKLLELGSPPFNLTLLVKKFRNFQMTLTGATADDQPRLNQTLVSEAFGESHQFACSCFDLERELFPFPSNEFDVVMWCEVIEHLTENPVFTLREIHRVLKPSGQLILSTPNVARVENILRLWRSLNVFDPYHLGAILRGSRHSREYTLTELQKLLNQCGFDIEIAEDRDLGQQHYVTPIGILERVLEFLGKRAPGAHKDHLFVRAAKTRPFHWSFPADLFDQGHLAWHIAPVDREVIMGRNDMPHTGPGWGVARQGPEGKLMRLAGEVSDGYLVASQECGAVTLEFAGTGKQESTVTVEAWQSQRGQSRLLASETLPLTPKRWSAVELKFRDAAIADEPVHLRILAPTTAMVHRMALEPLPG